MGIPSYFSYIIRTYSNIIRKDCGRVQLLLMDCNSIIYDAYRTLQEEYTKAPFELSTIEDRIISLTITRICDYILKISPDKLAYVTFDGVAPMAKIDQQRTRRYKSALFKNTSEIWNTTNITPGTPFMKNLSATVNAYFAKKHTHLRNINIKTSCSDEPGEGEHKLFQYVRDNKCDEDVAVVYGLDADLIMLSLLHIKNVKEIYVFREAPSFKTVISHEYKPGQLLYMDIRGLFNCIFTEMGNYDPKEKETRVLDYIMMCILLGNDFLPHILALNIRTNGMRIILEKYKSVNVRLVENGKIGKGMRKFIESVALDEKRILLCEMKERAKWEKRKWKREELVENVAVIYQQTEGYVKIGEEGWEKRYYRRVVGSEEKGKVSKRYIEGLNWVLEYYTKGCKDWEWKYEYGGAPLLKDIEIEALELKENKKILSEEEQLEYVMPTEEKLKRTKLEWGFMRYNWEGKIKINP